MSQVLTTKKPQTTKHISYGDHELKLLKMEDILMEHYGWNRSQLHKNLIRERYYEMKLV